MKSLEDKSGTIVARCNCTHDYQDKKYGKGQRVFNLTGKKEKRKATCTVCGAAV